MRYIYTLYTLQHQYPYLDYIYLFMARLRLYNIDKLVNSAKDYKNNWNNTIKSAKLAIFGHKTGYIGEEEWLKPLQGPSRTKWYWPSKYLHIDFSLRHYLAAHIARFKPKQDDPAIIDLWNVVSKFNSNKESIESFLNSVDSETFSNSVTLQDTHSLYYLIFKQSPLSFTVDKSVTSKFDNPKYLPFINYALRGLDKDFHKKKDIKLDVNLRNRLRLLLQENPSLVECFKTRNRFVDNLYLRRRNYYLDKISRKRKISEIKQKYKSHFLTHPDEKKIWPDSKGIHQHKWPSI